MHFIVPLHLKCRALGVDKEGLFKQQVTMESRQILNYIFQQAEEK